MFFLMNDTVFLQQKSYALDAPFSITGGIQESFKFYVGQVN